MLDKKIVETAAQQHVSPSSKWTATDTIFGAAWDPYEVWLTRVKQPRDRRDGPPPGSRDLTP